MAPVVTVCMADVVPRPVRWRWPGRFPLGKLSLLEGDPDLGKSLVTLDLIARATRGDVMPDLTRGDLVQPANAVMLVAEDDLADTVRPRLDAANADLGRVHVLRGTQQPGQDGVRPISLEDINQIRQAITQHQARLATVDPFSAHLGDSSANNEAHMRALLTPLAEMAAETDAAIVIIRHWRKEGGTGVTSGSGSQAITAAARSVFLVARDPEDPEGRVFAKVKMNLAASAVPTLKYTIASRPIIIGGEAHAYPHLAWSGTSNASANELASREFTQEAESSKDVEQWLLDALADRPMAAKALDEAAVRAGHKPRTLERARAKLVRAQRIWKKQLGTGAVRAWYWGVGAEPDQSWLDEHASWGRHTTADRQALTPPGVA